MKLNSVVTTIRIRIDQIEKINESGLNLSEFVRNKIDEEFETTETLSIKENELLKELQTIKNKKELIGNIKKIEMSKEERKFIEGARKRVNDMPGELQENCRVYNLQFGKRISIIKFKEILN